jgi:hypothetical protein
MSHRRAYFWWIEEKLRWKYLMCRLFNRHNMVLYSVGQNYGRECQFCKRPGLMSEADWDFVRRPAPVEEVDGETP